MLRRGIPVFMGEVVYEEILKEGRISGISPLPEHKKTFIGHYEIQPFQVHHNVPNYGFLIVTPSKERIVFVTDATECKYRFKDIDCIMVECNHDDDTLLDNLDKHEVSMSHPENHMGLQECISFCKANYNSSLKRIILIHLSSSNISEHYALESVQEALPYCEPVVPVAVAHPNDTFLIENDNF